MNVEDENVLKQLNYFVSIRKIPNLIFHGSSGTGKRTIVGNFINQIYGGDRNRVKSNVMFVNCAHGKGIRFIRDEIVPGGLKIIAVGGKKSAAADAAFDEFGKSPPQWGDWITKEYNQALNSYQIQENIQSPKCIAVLIITKPASHALTNQAKEAAEKAGRPVVWIEEATKKKIREGMKSLVEKIVAQSELSPQDVR